MNIFTKNKTKIFAHIFSLILFLMILISFLPNMAFAGPKWDAFKGSAWNPGNWFPERSGSIKIGNSPTYNFGYEDPNAGKSVYTNKTPENFNDLIMNTIISGMLRPIVTLLVGSAVVVFLWGVFKFIRSEGKEKETGRSLMVWGIVGIFIMVSVWGLVNILRNTFNLDDETIDISNVLLK